MRGLLVILLSGCAAGAPSTAPTHHGAGGGAARLQDLPAAPAVTQKAPKSLDALLTSAREKHDLPGLAALVLRDGQVVAEGAVGVRSVSDEAGVTRADPWHLGSCTKSMTATLAALLVARGELTFDTTIGAIFPDVEMHPAWREVTLAHLLTNSSGAPTALDADGLWLRLWEREGTPAEERRKLVEGVLARAPEAPAGERFIYSNAGFSIAGTMLEVVTGTPFEELMTQELFTPLGMRSAGFGAPGDPEAEHPTAPLGHVHRRDQLLPQPLGFGDDNPPSIAPAGLVHAPLRDWAKYADLHLRGARGEEVPDALAGVAFDELHRPRVENYAMGWVVSEPEWCRGRLIWHNGSNNMWYCEAALFPDDNLAILVATNTAHGTSRGAVGGVVALLYTLHRK